MAGFLHFRIRDRSQRGEARRAAAAQAAALGFDEERAGRVALVVSELAGNLVKHVAGGGDLFVRSVERAGGAAVEVVAVDRGGGIADERRALRDGYSTAGSAGTGLGAVSRVSDVFDLYSSPGRGAAVVARVRRERADEEPAPAVGGICAAKEGEPVTGDAFSVVDRAGRARILVVDGLGHGLLAERAAAEAVQAFHEDAEGSVAGTLDALHRALRPTRGAAVAVAELDASARRARYVGIGNISGAIIGSEGGRNLVSHHGIVGHQMAKVQEFEYPLPPEALVVLHSDGLGSRWSLDAYPGLRRRDPSVIAAVLYRDFERGRDDAAAVVARVP